MADDRNLLNENECKWTLRQIVKSTVNYDIVVYLCDSQYICISGSELLVRVSATGAVVGTVYDAGSNDLRGVYELGDNLIVVLKSPYIKRLNFNLPFYSEIDTYNYIAGISEVIPYLVMIFCMTDIVANISPNLFQC